MLKDLIREALPDLGPDTAGNLLRQLEDVGEEIAVDAGAKLAARGLVKGIDLFARVAVKNLSRDEADDLTTSYVDAIVVQLDQLIEAIQSYAPLAFAVEAAKKEHGDKSAEANAARRAREVAMNELRQEVRDVLKAATGGEVAD